MLRAFLTACVAISGICINSAPAQTGPSFSSTSFAAGITNPAQVRLGDWNIDGTLDLVISSGLDIKHFIGDGQGSFSSGSILGLTIPLQASAGTSRIEVADLNGDGASDVLKLHEYSQVLVPFGSPSVKGDAAIFFGSPSGLSPAAAKTTLFQTTNTPLFASFASLAMGDLDAGGFPDLVFGTYFVPPSFFSTRVSQNNGGVLAPSSVAILAIAAGQTTLRDVNVDGKLDFVVPSVAVALGNGLGGFGPALQFGTLSSNGSGAVASVDMNADGFPDVACATYQGTTIFIGGTFGILTQGPSLSIGNALPRIQVADMNGDAYLDIVGVSGNPGILEIAAGQGNLNFHTPVAYPYVSSPVDFGVGDLNNDGANDVVALDLSNVTTLLSVGGPVALQVFGLGTAGCNGPEVLSANKPPKVNTPTFQLACTNAPPNATGLWMIGNVGDLQGSDPFGANAKFHIDVFATTELFTFNTASDAAGYATCPTPIPNNPSLTAQTFYAQAFWIWPLNICLNFPIGLSTSSGLAITVLPG